MKKFQFRLERILRFHQQRLKQAELRVMQAAMERDTASADVRRCVQQIERACQLNESVGAIINPSIRTNVTAHLDQLSAILASAQERLNLCERRFREQQRVRAEITQDVEGFSHLRDVQRSHYRDAVNRQQQIELDEIVMRQWSVQGADNVSRSMELLE